VALSHRKPWPWLDRGSVYADQLRFGRTEIPAWSDRPRWTGAPQTAALEEQRRTCSRRMTIDSSKVIMPVTFWVVCSGRLTETICKILKPARCTTPEMVWSVKIWSRGRAAARCL